MPKQPKEPTLRLDLLLDEYERDLRRQEYVQQTLQGYRRVHEPVFRFWGDRFEREPTLDDFTVRNVEHFLDHLLERGHARSGKPLSSETLRTYVTSVRTTRRGRAEHQYPKRVSWAENSKRSNPQRD